MHLAGLVMKWCTMIPQITRMSRVGIRKLVTQVQNIQRFWKEDKNKKYQNSPMMVMEKSENLF